MLAHDLIVAGSNEIMIAGGMESMTNAPYLMPKRARLPDGHQTVYDTCSRRPRGRLRQGPPDGTFAEDCAQSYVHARGADISR